MRELDRRLATYGADVARWPEGSAEARDALLREPEFRRAWERERAFDRRLTAERNALDAEIAGSDAMTRLGRLASRRGAGFLADIPWRRVAAGVLIAGLLGGALDRMLPAPPADPIELALVDPLAGLDAQ